MGEGGGAAVDLPVAEVLHTSKLLVGRKLLASELTMLTRLLNRVAERDRTTRDFTLNDLARALRTRPHPERLPILHALSAVVLAARAHGKLPLDAVYNDVRDPAGFTRECEQGRSLGFAGKTVIHPDQVASANTAFGVTDEEAGDARALLATWQQARAVGKSVAVWRGALIEQMHADEAQELLTLWQATRADLG